MFGAMRDRLKGALYGGRLRWQEIVATFELLYPDVKIRRPDRGVPVAFIVWRAAGGKYWIDLLESKEMALRWIRNSMPDDPDVQRIANELWQRRQSIRSVELDSKRTPHAYGHVLNWGLFDYSCEAGVGDFAANGFGYNEGFVNTFVIEDDKPMFQRGR